MDAKSGGILHLQSFFGGEISILLFLTISKSVRLAIKEPGIDTKSVPGLFLFIWLFNPKSGVFSNFATHFDFRCPPPVLLPTLRITKPLHIALFIR